MNLFYAVLAYVMAIYNVRQAMTGMDTMNYVLAAMWLAIGIFCTVKHLQDRKKNKKKQEMKQQEEI